MKKKWTFFERKFLDNNFGFPFDIGDPHKIFLFKIFVDYLRNNSEKTKQKLDDYCGIDMSDRVMLTFNCHYDLFYLEKMESLMDQSTKDISVVYKKNDRQLKIICWSNMVKLVTIYITL